MPDSTAMMYVDYAPALALQFRRHTQTMRDITFCPDFYAAGDFPMFACTTMPGDILEDFLPQLCQAPAIGS
jgi:hypothetical protein